MNTYNARHTERLFVHAAELLRILWKTPQPLEDVTSEFLSGKKGLDSADRQAISSLVFTALRLRLLIDAVTTACPPAPSAPVQTAERRAVAAAFTLGTRIGVYRADPRIFAPEEAEARAHSPFPQMRSSPIPGTPADDAAPFHDHSQFHEASRFHEALDSIEHTAATLLETARLPDPTELSALAAYASCPGWMLESWSARAGGWPRACAIGASLRAAAPVALRVNTQVATVDSVLAALQDAGIDARPSSLSPSGIVLESRARVTGLDSYAAGAFEVQDEGSQIVGFALDPRPGSRVHDACAGAGGKTLHAADLMHDSGTILATDVERKRLSSLAWRAQRCGFASISTQTISKIGTRDPGADFHGSMFDTVLVDAPCSGTGTARRNPAVKWRVTPRQLARLSATQYEILEHAARGVNAGGIVLYATCSLMPEENEQVVDRFLREHPEFIPDPLGPAFARHDIHALENVQGHCLLLTPYEHGTDGFFMARLKRRVD